MLFAFTVYKLTVLIYSIDPEVSKKVFRRNLGKAGTFTPNDYGYDFAFSMKNGDLKPEIGHYKLKHIHQVRQIDPETGES